MTMQTKSNLIARDWLAVGDGHDLHIAQYGNQDGVPLLYLHGGPGAGCSVDELALFDLSIYRVIFMDQRGAGRSRPLGELRHNNIDTLLADIERVRQWLGLEKWVLAGGSFGATLALLYAGLHPERVTHQVLWGVFIPSDDSILWLYSQRGAALLSPAEYLAFSSSTLTTMNELQSMLVEYRAGLEHESAATRQDFVRRWLKWEIALAYPHFKLNDHNLIFSQALASIEHYYVTHNYFNAFEMLSCTITHIQADTIILQGSHDWVCPIGFVDSFLSSRVNERIKVIDVIGGYHALADEKMATAVINALRDLQQ
ncbi:alpha/beta fold hydrolase [Shewanella youngdeokensis]|uniref:Proline iminopeptidase n=1 Tax=Shewanella youngdeokensis TaxID=2999068 RepID=A0ABZ0JZJ3_9GAMM|nr:alpha/beta fold hydrolase [Shewanella sp. DAU334]